jgi:N utilization substance protein A
VDSKDANVDSVGACVGMRGIRVQSIVNELNGEKIDIIAYDSDPAGFIKNALSPAKITQIKINKDTKTATVVVEDSQLSLAIGKGGQNVRLAAKLVGWKLDIKSQTQFDEEQRIRKSIPISSLKGVGPKLEAKFASVGVSTLFDILNLKPEDLASIPGIGKVTAEKILEEANRLDKESLEKLRETMKT